HRPRGPLRLRQGRAERCRAARRHRPGAVGRRAGDRRSQEPRFLALCRCRAPDPEPAGAGASHAARRCRRPGGRRGGLAAGRAGGAAGGASRRVEPAGLPAILVTRGEAGMTLVRSGAPPVHLPAEAREVFDVSGAGDSVLAALAMALAAGADLVAAARLANIAGGIAVGRTGTTAVSLADLAEALHARAVHRSTAAKALHLPTPPP